MAPLHLSAEQLSQFVDGECSPDERRRANEHLFACAECRGLFESFRAVDLDLRRAPLVACETALPLISARLDAETDEAQAAVAERHLEACASCSATERQWSQVSVSLAALPAGSPSAAVDDAISALARRETRRPSIRPVFVSRALVAVTAAMVIVVAGLSRGAPLAALQPTGDQAIVAAAQQVVFNEATSTLYVLDVVAAAVEVRDSVTSELKARIDVGGTPTALALNTSTNTVLVLDAAQKRVTEISGASNSVVSSSSVPLSGTLTSINVEPTGGRIVVTSSADAGANTGSSGSLVVLDASTKQVETLRDLAVEPGVMIYDPTGHRTAIVSSKQTTLLDENYKVIGTLPGGISAAFGKKGNDRIAVLGSSTTGATVSFGGLGALVPLQLPGSPRAITALPDGGFLVLVQLDKKSSRVTHLTADGAVSGDVDLAITGVGLAYDENSDRFTVVNGDKVVRASVPAQAATTTESAAPAASASLSASPSPAASASLAPSASPSASATPSASPSATPSTAPVVAANGPPNALQLASSVNEDLVRFALPNGRLPVLVTKSGERLWVLDDRNGVVTIDMSSGDMFTPLRLPADAQISQWKTGRSYAYALDTNEGVLYVINVRDERVDAHEMPLLKPVVSAAVGLDDRLWMAVRGAPYLLAYDPAKGVLSSFDLGAARVSLLMIDSLGRIVYADDARSTAGVFDPKTQVLNEVRLPAHAPATGLVIDSSSTLWVGTTAGEIFNVRGGRAALVLSLQVPVTGLSLDQTGHVWYLAPLPKGAFGFSFAALDEGVAGSVNGPVASLDFSALGRAWLADPRGGFFVSREQLR